MVRNFKPGSSELVDLPFKTTLSDTAEAANPADIERVCCKHLAASRDFLVNRDVVVFSTDKGWVVRMPLQDTVISTPTNQMFLSVPVVSESESLKQ